MNQSMINLKANTMEQKTIPGIMYVKNKLWILIIMSATLMVTAVFSGCKKNYPTFIIIYQGKISFN